MDITRTPFFLSLFLFLLNKKTPLVLLFFCGVNRAGCVGMNRTLALFGNTMVVKIRA